MVNGKIQNQTSKPAHKQRKFGNVLVTGADGFIGQHLCRALLAKNVKVTALDLKFSSDNSSLLKLSEQNKNLSLITGSISETAFITRHIDFSDYDCIFNLAAHASVIGKAVEEPLQTFMVNSLGAAILVEAARNAEKTPVILHASTDKVYGCNEGEAYDEVKTVLTPRGPYDISKRIADDWLLEYSRQYQLPVVVLRMCNIFGPGDEQFSRIVPASLQAIFKNSKPSSPQIYSDSKEHKREYLYIDDCVNAMISLASHPDSYGRAVNLFGTETVTTYEMVNEIVAAAIQIEQQIGTEERAQAIRNNGIEIINRQHAKAPEICDQKSNGSRIRELIDFHPQTDLVQGLKQTALAYRQYYGHVDESQELPITL